MAYIGKSPTGSGVRTRYYYTATGGETSLSGADDNGKTLTFSDGEYMDVYLNGVLLVHGTDYGTGTANTISSLAALSGGDIAEVIVYDVYNIADVNRKALRTRYYKTAAGGETSISGTDDSGATITFAANAQIEVKLNGVSLVQGTDYNTTSANTVGGLAALTAGQVVEIVKYERFVLGDTVSKADGGTFSKSIGIDADGATVLTVDRATNDGTIIDLQKDGTTVGSIGTVLGDIYINTGSTGLRFYDVTSQVIPVNGSGANRDNAIDLGNSGVRFDDIYATNGTIQTSDANEKQQIASLTDAEITAAKAISALFKTFKWNSAVEAKGEAARIHAGVIAQDVEAAMTAAGLDAGDYAFFISSTWWETQTEVPAVEAVDEVLDEDGNVVTEAVEAVAAYTRTDTYDTAEEAPEGATERTRKGIRYPELLAFIGAATEQRLIDIEARIAALETA